MRHFALALLFAAPLLAAGCNKNEAENASANAAAAKSDAVLYTVMAGTITGSRAAGINSWFRIQKANAGDPNAIESDRRGGACIIFRASDLGYDVGNTVCNVDDDCKPDEGPRYCETTTHVCWARPMPTGDLDPLCKRSIDTLPQEDRQWNEGDLNWISAQKIPVPHELKANAQARVVALLRRKGDAGPPMVKWGDPKPLP